QQHYCITVLRTPHWLPSEWGWEILRQLPVQRVDLLGADVAYDQRRTVGRHSTPFAPLREKPPDVLQAYNSPNLSVRHSHPEESWISGKRCVKAYVFAVR